MPTKQLDERFRRILLGLAAFVIMEPLLLIPVIVTAARRPDLLWLVLGPYLLFTAAAMVLLFVVMGRWGLLNLGPLTPVLVRFGLAFTVATALLVVASWLWASLGWLWLAAYLAATVWLVAWLVRWQAANLAFRCDDCDRAFVAPARRWLLSLNMGNRKRVTCPHCGGHWATFVRREEASPERASPTRR